MENAQCKMPKMRITWCRIYMKSIRQALTLAGAKSSDLEAILEALATDSIGYKADDDASGPFTELDPAILGQPPYGLKLSVERCNIVKKAVRQAQD